MLGDLIVELLPWGGRSVDPDCGDAVLKKLMPGRLHVPETDSPGAIKRALNESGWFEDKVIAAGDVHQGKEPSVVAMLTGSALVEAMRRRCKALPRQFLLAVTRDRVLAFKVLSSGDDFGDVYELWIRPGAVGSWPRSAVRTHDVAGDATAATLELDGAGRVPVPRHARPLDPGALRAAGSVTMGRDGRVGAP